MVNLQKKFRGSKTIDKTEAYKKVTDNYESKIYLYNELPFDIKQKVDISNVVNSYSHNANRYITE